jgi:hypothetical protein
MRMIRMIVAILMAHILSPKSSAQEDATAGAIGMFRQPHAAVGCGVAMRPLAGMLRMQTYL